jgi:hypothetical protein
MRRTFEGREAAIEEQFKIAKLALREEKCREGLCLR